HEFFVDRHAAAFQMLVRFRFDFLELVFCSIDSNRTCVLCYIHFSKGVTMLVTQTENALLDWYASLDTLKRLALNYWLRTGDTGLLIHVIRKELIYKAN